MRLDSHALPLPPLRLLVWLILLWPLAVARAEAPRVLPEGQLPHDARLEKLKDLNGYFPFVPCESPEPWARRSERVRRQMLVATGLWPMPTKTPANAVLHGKVERPEYTVEKVYLESFPGHFVSGSLYRPKGRSGRLPGVLCPHGHWARGRFYDAGREKVRQEIEDGAEKFSGGGRYPIQARCVQLARMGCVVFQYDMVGYADSQQLSHGPGVREQMNTAENWGYFSPQAEARLQNMMGLQTYNSIRVLDWFSELPDVDPVRIAVTGASGGGTQTFMLCAIDPRPAVAFPAVMVSTAMQGGCTCENACYLRIGTSNVEFAALFAPRPLGMTAADDWTKEIASKGLPELERHYRMLGVEDLVMAKPLLQFGHNYNYVSRAVMYGWLNKHLKLGADEPIIEEDFQPLTREEMSVFDREHPRPPGGDDHERALLRWITEDSRTQMAALAPTDGESLAAYRRVVGGAVDVMIGRGLPGPGSVKVSDRLKPNRREGGLVTALLSDAQTGAELPVLCLVPEEGQPLNGQIVIWIDALGKQALLDDHGQPRPAIRRLLAAGACVAGADLFGQGEFTPNGHPLAKAPLVRDDYAGYTFGYNHPTFSRRVHDILSLVAAARSEKLKAKRVDLVGLRGAGHWVAAARAQAGEAIDRAVIDMAGFRFARLTAIDDPDFLPGGAKYGDLPAFVALSAPCPVWLADAGSEIPKIVAAAYRAAGAAEKLTFFDGEEDREAAAVAWLLQRAEQDSGNRGREGGR
ncbi:MAG: acetylxylan esterase [Pirellulales bacterium]|nr:acetylxylan esterase [Pirellulales bacterium]